MPRQSPPNHTVILDGYAAPGGDVQHQISQPTGQHGGSLPITGAEAVRIGLLGLSVIAIGVIVRNIGRRA